MSEIELQGLLDRTNPLDEDPEAMDMIVIDGVRISKFDIRALKVGKNVPFELNEELKKFNSVFLAWRGERFSHQEWGTKDTHTV